MYIYTYMCIVRMYSIYIQCKLYMCTVQCVNAVDNGRVWWQQAILPVLPLPSAHSILDTNFVLINSKFTSQYFIAARVSGHYLDPCLHCICYCQCCLVWRACVIHFLSAPYRCSPRASTSTSSKYLD